MPRNNHSLVEHADSLLVAADLVLAEATRLVEKNEQWYKLNLERLQQRHHGAIETLKTADRLTVAAELDGLVVHTPERQA